MSRKLLTRDRSVKSSEAKSFLVFNIVKVLNVGYGAPQKHRGLFVAQLVKLELIFECGFIHHTNTITHMHYKHTQTKESHIKG